MACQLQFGLDRDTVRLCHGDRSTPVPALRRVRRRGDAVHDACPTVFALIANERPGTAPPPMIHGAEQHRVDEWPTRAVVCYGRLC